MMSFVKIFHYLHRRTDFYIMQDNLIYYYNKANRPEKIEKKNATAEWKKMCCLTSALSLAKKGW